MTLIKRFTDCHHDDLPLVGGKIASLGTMMVGLQATNIQIPKGFAVTTAAFDLFLSYNKLDKKIADLLAGIDYEDNNSLQNQARAVRRLISAGERPETLHAKITETYHILSAIYKTTDVDVAVRSSATAEDLPDYSFAGQQDSYLNVHGSSSLLDHIRDCFASLYNARAISYRHHNGFGQAAVKLAVAVQKMVRADLAGSGVCFSLDPDTGFDQVVTINAVHGLGELLVGGHVQPQEYIVHKVTGSLIDHTIRAQDEKMIYKQSNTQLTHIPLEQQHDPVLTPCEAKDLAQQVMQIEQYFGTVMDGQPAVDVEWAKDGLDGQLYIIQARPETVHSTNTQQAALRYHIQDTDQATVLLSGIAVGQRVAGGQVQHITHISQAADFVPGKVLVTDMTDPDREPLMRQASAIVTNRGGRTCHAAIIAREIGIPAIVGTANGTKILQAGQEVTVVCCQGHTGYVYEGKLPFDTSSIDYTTLPTPPVPLMMNIANPAIVFGIAHLPHQGVGLARMEFIINNWIGVHPLALLQHHTLQQTHMQLAGQISERIQGFASPRDYFVQQLRSGVARIAAAMYPHQVIVRCSDFKSNEYAKLLGGELFEPHEENPMLGWRGASRYYDDAYRDAFTLECEALASVRNELGLTNVTVMIPFCRTPAEGRKVIDLMAQHGLVQGENNLEIYMMCEVPSNIFLAEEFLTIFDGYSIGSNDLTQLILGIDRDSGKLAHLFDEQNAAVKQAISHVIAVAKRMGKKIGICGQAPSDHPDFAQFLVDEGISSISLNPDQLVGVMQAIGT